MFWGLLASTLCSKAKEIVPVLILVQYLPFLKNGWHWTLLRNIPLPPHVVHLMIEALMDGL